MEKSNNRWFDIKVVLAVLATTASLFLWNVFARDSVTVSTTLAAQSRSTSASSSVPQTRILLGSSAPQSPSVSMPSFSAPAPERITGSSRP